MYEHITYEGILKQMMNRVLEKHPDLDTREGSILYNALAPAAVEMQNLYIQMDWVMNQSFADTQIREFLVRRCAERGIVPGSATKAVLKGEFNIPVPIGSRFSLELINYQVKEFISEGVYKLECEQYGEEGNHHLGTLLPIDYITGLTKAELTQVLIPGEEEEDTEHLRKRYFSSLNSQAFGGNIADYKEKINTIEGIGAVKVYPVWNGGGTVKLVLVNSEYQIPSEELIQKVKEIVDPEVNSGQGYGIAPIGHQVTVVGAVKDTLTIETKLTYQTEWNFERCKEMMEAAIDGYLKELNSKWEDNDQIVVRISQIESRLLDIQGILDVADTMINGNSGNYQSESDAIVVRGDLIGT